MKRRIFLLGWLGLPIALLVLVTSVLGQKQPSGTSGQLDQAALLMEQGNPQSARALLVNISQTDPNYGLAMCYNAICLYQLGDQKAFLKAVASPAVQAAPVPASVREDLDLKQIKVLLVTRKFEDLLPKIQAFQTNHVGSTNLNVVYEYHLAGLFERGMKKTYEACVMGNTNEYLGRWNMGKTNLEEFLSLCPTNESACYQYLTNRVLKENIWVARMTLGDEQGVLSGMPGGDKVDLETAGLLGIQLYQKLQPKEVDANLQRMADFIDNFPQSKRLKKVRFDMANISFSQGETMIKQAAADEDSGDAIKSANDRAKADGYFEYTRGLQDLMVVDTASGIEAADVFDREDDLLNSYYLEKDFSTLESQANTLIQGAMPGELQWMMAKLYLAIGLASQSPPDLNQAAANLDQVLAIGFNAHPDHNMQVVTAAKWRVYVAQQAGDNAKAIQIIQWVQGSDCTKNQKAAFMNIYSVLLTSQKTSSK